MQGWRARPRTDGISELYRVTCSRGATGVAMQDGSCYVWARCAAGETVEAVRASAFDEDA
jgi:hypothetical protein